MPAGVLHSPHKTPLICFGRLKVLLGFEDCHVRASFVSCLSLIYLNFDGHSRVFFKCPSIFLRFSDYVGHVKENEVFFSMSIWQC